MPKSAESPLLDFQSILKNKVQQQPKTSTSTAKQQQVSNSKSLPKFYVDLKYKAPDINNDLLQLVVMALAALRIANLTLFVTGWTRHKFWAIANFKEACKDYDLPFRLGKEQIAAFLEYLKIKNYGLATIQKNWATFKIVAEHLKFNITHEILIHFDYVADQCKQLIDGWLPVTKILLQQLIQAADKVLQGYNVLLAQTTFICPYAFSMRVGEYTLDPSKKRATYYRDHNLLANGIRIADEHISISFQSDKAYSTFRLVITCILLDRTHF